MGRITQSATSLLCLSLLLACGGDNDSAPEQSSTASTSAASAALDEVVPEAEEGSEPSAAPTNPEAASESTSAASLPEAEVRALLQRWLRAQNEGDVEAYAALYATRFFGIKRAGSRTYSFDRSGWLADRGRMFTRPMQVAALEPEVKVSVGSAALRFTQAFSSGRFSDEGPKQLVVVREGDDLRIAREDMLSSVVADDQRAEGSGLLRALTFEGHGYVILRRDAEAGWAEGAPRVVAAGHPSAAERRASSALPADLRAWRGREVVTGGGGGGCRTRIEEVSVMSVLNPHFDTVEQWRGRDEGPALPRAQVAREIVFMAGPAFVVGRLEGCAGSTWVSASSNAGVALRGVVAGVDDGLRAAILTRFRALPAYLEQQTEAEAAGVSGPWDRPIVKIWSEEGGAPRVVTVHTYVGGCGGDYEGMLFAAFEIGGEQPLTLTDAGTGVRSFLIPESVADINGDGHFEIVGRALDGDFVHMRGTPILREERSRAYIDMDCGC